ncbi:MAG: phage holin family protein [Jatrophihabitans sp.]
MTTTQPSPIVTPAEPTIGSLASDASKHLSTIIRGEIALAKSEVGSSVKNAGTGIGMFLGAAVLLVFSLTFGLIALAEGLVSIGLWRWLSYLIVFGFLVLMAAVLVFIGVRKIKRVKSPKKTISNAKDTADVLKHPSKHTA